MFDLERHKILIGEHFFKLFHSYRKPELAQKFIRRWLELLKVYSELPNFVSFGDRAPVLKRLQPNARAVLIVPFENTIHYFHNPRVSVFPLYPFRVQLTHKGICCKEGLELLLIYLEMTGIRLIGFYDVVNYKKIMESLPRATCYPPALFKYFCSKVKQR